MFAFDGSRMATGRAIRQNWIGLTIGQIKANWTNQFLNNDQIWVTTEENI